MFDGYRKCTHQLSSSSPSSSARHFHRGSGGPFVDVDVEVQERRREQEQKELEWTGEVPRVRFDSEDPTWKIEDDKGRV